MKARKETPTRGAPAVCFHAMIQKVLISENHKAQTLAAVAANYVQKPFSTLFIQIQNLLWKGDGWTQRLHYNDKKSFYKPQS